jgi:hypothetical protein
MPKAAKKKANAPQVKKTKLNLQVRDILADAYSFVLGEKFTASVSSVSLETLMQEQINQIEGTDGKTDIRNNKRGALTKLVNGISEVVRVVKELPPSSFSVDTEDREGGNVNTPVSGSGGEIPS